MEQMAQKKKKIQQKGAKQTFLPNGYYDYKDISQRINKKVAYGEEEYHYHQ